MKYDPDLAKKINAQKSPKPEGSGKPKETKPPITSPNMQYQFLSGDAGKQVHEAIQDKYKGIEAVTKVVYDDKAQVVKGSNPFYVVAVNEQLREIKDRKLRTATMADLERILKTNALPLRGQYEDTALVLRNLKETNPYLANHLAQQLKSRGINLADIPLLIQLRSLQLARDSKSPHKLSFKLTDESEIIEAPYLAHNNNQRKFNSLDDAGAPIFDENGTRYLWTIASGLSRLYLNGSLGVGSGDEDLAYSSEGGRVVVCDEVADAKNGGP